MNKNAVVVGKGDVKKELELLKKGQDYDDYRRIRTHDEKSIEIPVHGAGGEMKNRIVINQKSPQIRARGLKDLLREEGVSEEEIKISPGSWDVIGEIALVQFSEKCTTKKEIGECLMKLQGVNTVLSRVGIEGTERKPIIKYIEMPENLINQYQYFTQADMIKIKKSGYKNNFYSLEDGVSDYVNNYLLTDNPYR